MNQENGDPSNEFQESVDIQQPKQVAPSAERPKVDHEFNSAIRRYFNERIGSVDGSDAAG